MCVCMENGACMVSTCAYHHSVAMHGRKKGRKEGKGVDSPPHRPLLLVPPTHPLIVIYPFPAANHSSNSSGPLDLMVRAGRDSHVSPPFIIVGGRGLQGKERNG